MNSNEMMYILEDLFEADSAEELLYALESLLAGGAAAGEASTSMFGLLGGIVGWIIGALLAVALYLVSAISVYSLAKKANYKLAWLAWIPLCQPLVCTFVLYQSSGKDAFEFINGKLKVNQGIWMFVGYAVASVVGGAIISFVNGLIGSIPVIGVIWAVIAFIPNIIFSLLLGAFQYVYLRDFVGIFKSDLKKIQIHCFIVTLLDVLLTGGWARAIYLLTMMKLQPLEVPAFEADVVDAPISAE